jgi:hypothetical protein
MNSKFNNIIKFTKESRAFHWAIIDILLLLILIIIYYYGNISEKSMPICLIGTYILSRYLLVATYMYLRPYKCELGLCT